MMPEPAEVKAVCPCCGQYLPKTRNCAWCGKGFSYGKRTGRRKTAKYCSSDCRKRAWLRIREGRAKVGRMQ
jgi:hypothetical protein